MATGSAKYQERKLAYKSVAFPDANNEFVMKEIRGKKSHSQNFRKKKYLELNFTKELKDLCKENFKTLKK